MDEPDQALRRVTEDAGTTDLQHGPHEGEVDAVDLGHSLTVAREVSRRPVDPLSPCRGKTRSVLDPARQRMLKAVIVRPTARAELLPLRLHVFRDAIPERAGHDQFTARATVCRFVTAPANLRFHRCFPDTGDLGVAVHQEGQQGGAGVAGPGDINDTNWGCRHASNVGFFNLAPRTTRQVRCLQRMNQTPWLLG